MMSLKFCLLVLVLLTVHSDARPRKGGVKRSAKSKAAANFEKSQINDFKEGVSMLDQNREAVIAKRDLPNLVKREVDEMTAENDEMTGEASDSVDIPDAGHEKDFREKNLAYFLGDSGSTEEETDEVYDLEDLLINQMAKKIAVGIDLGPTYSSVGLFQHGKVEIIANDQGNRNTPSYVAFTDAERLVGDQAKKQVAINPSNTFFDTNRLNVGKFEDRDQEEFLLNASPEVNNDEQKDRFTADELVSVIEMGELSENVDLEPVIAIAQEDEANDEE